MGILKGIFKARDKPKDTLSGGRYNFFFGSTSAGKPVNEHTAMQMTTVYSVSGYYLKHWRACPFMCISTMLQEEKRKI
jgi:hypothetical protein